MEWILLKKSDQPTGSSERHCKRGREGRKLDDTLSRAKLSEQANEAVEKPDYETVSL